MESETNHENIKYYNNLKEHLKNNKYYDSNNLKTKHEEINWALIGSYDSYYELLKDNLSTDSNIENIKQGLIVEYLNTEFFKKSPSDINVWFFKYFHILCLTNPDSDVYIKTKREFITKILQIASNSKMKNEYEEIKDPNELIRVLFVVLLIMHFQMLISFFNNIFINDDFFVNYIKKVLNITDDKIISIDKSIMDKIDIKELVNDFIINFKERFTYYSIQTAPIFSLIDIIKCFLTEDQYKVIISIANNEIFSLANKYLLNIEESSDFLGDSIKKIKGDENKDCVSEESESEISDLENEFKAVSSIVSKIGSISKNSLEEGVEKFMKLDLQDSILKIALIYELDVDDE